MLCQQAWCCIGHPIIEYPKTVAVTPATELGIHRLGLLLLDTLPTTRMTELQITCVPDYQQCQGPEVS